MPTQLVATGLTYEQWRLLPESMLPQEVIDGELRMSPPPSSEHQWVLQSMADVLSPFVRSQRLGVVLVAPVDVLIRRSPLRTRQPDLLFLSHARTGFLGRRELREMPVIEVAPDLVVEVLSPSNTRTAMDERLQDYCVIGVLECWLVSPEAETVELLRLTPDGPRRVALHGAGDVLRSDLLPGLELPVTAIFA